MTIHFIGIGGIGVSALAKYYLKKGWRVSGCDLARSEITDQLKKMGAHIRIGDTSKIDTCIKLRDQYSQIVYSPAVPKNHPERAAARKQGIPELSYPQALGELTRSHCTIAVSGTHGKSTTTAMIGLLLTKAGFDPTVIVGTKLKEFGNSNCRVGKSKYLIIEADEHFASFLNYWPKIIVLTTIEADHLDYWKTLKNLINGFLKYTTHIPQDGTLIANKDDKNIQSILKKSKTKIQGYSLKQKEASVLQRILKVPGQHNVSNALAALTVARLLRIPDKTSYQSLSQYKGSWRRFEIFSIKKPKPYTLVSDYGHHPTEIKVTLQAAREKWPKKNIWLIYQPHQYQRTFYLFKEFVKVLSRLPVQKLILLDIYDVAGREEGNIKKKVSSAKLLKAIQAISYPLQATALHIPTAEEAERYIKKHLKGGEVLMIMGAGDIYQKLTLQLTHSL